eukprot:TRINITY_DN40902_c0_g1_i1.p1 TRINITY_DN40902_c0_g1~~TRINITY_DN40902_c0_g1_i1.p1  ORF type:complete len:811 (-),score=226.07 TRINITY_DN40902_c0_g1_i1:197-2629(-)
MASLPMRAWSAEAFLVALLGLCWPLPVGGNWLLQCSSCLDQALYSDSKIKQNVEDADLQTIMQQIKHIKIREFDHGEDEFFNKFFSKRQLGIMAHELQPVMPTAVGVLPERRWTNPKGVTNQTKNVMLVRETHLLFATLGAVQVMAKKADVWDESIAKLFKENAEIVSEQEDNRKKREDLIQQMVRTVAKVEVMQHGFAKTEEAVARMDGLIARFKDLEEEKHKTVLSHIWQLQNKSVDQDASIEQFKEEFRWAVDREARADLVEKRKQSEADLEVQLVKRSIEKLRWEEEQKTIELRNEEQRKSEEHSTQKHHERVAYETAQKKAADLELMGSQEESNLRQQAQKHKDEKELLELRLKSDERRAEMGVQEAIEKAKIEEEGKRIAARENEDVNKRMMQAEQEEKRQSTLAAIKATAEIAADWIRTVFTTPSNLALLIGSIVSCLGGIYLVREMAILLREQLNKRLGRPSLVRMTNRRGTFQEVGTAILRFLRLRPPRGAEFNDVVLHPKLRQQVMRLADATGSAKRRRMPLQHAMFYGPPGTGKTMVAQRFAEYSGLEYAIMSGGDVAPLEEQAVTELHKLFRWVHRSKRGVLLFIDEADAFLASRKNAGMSESLRNALTTMLYHTGTPSSQFMLVIATNRPHDLDSAILDRLDESVEFGLPDYEARKGMVQLYYEKYISKPLNLPMVSSGTPMLKKPQATSLRSRLPGSPKRPEIPREEMVDENVMGVVAERIHGFSGREISKLFTSLQTHVLYSGVRGGLTCTKSMLYEVVDQKVAEHGRTADFQVSGYEYFHSEPRDADAPEHTKK